MLEGHARSDELANDYVGSLDPESPGRSGVFVGCSYCIDDGLRNSHSPSFFRPAVLAVDPVYAAVRDGEADFAREARGVVESLWRAAAQYVDADIQQKAAVSFHPHFWELYLAACLLRDGMRLVPRSRRGLRDRGPDLQMEQPPVWIEAIAPTQGTGPDAVTDGIPGMVRDVPDDGIKLRILSAIQEKFEKFEHYVRNGTISSSDPCVVAVNTGMVQKMWGDREVPRIVRSLFPFGHEVIEISRRDGRVVGRRHEHTPAVIKQNGAAVPTTGFETPGWARISMVIHSPVDVFNGTSAEGREFVTVHNPHAVNPLPLGLLKLGTEYWAEQQMLRGRRWWMAE